MEAIRLAWFVVMRRASAPDPHGNFAATWVKVTRGARREGSAL